VLETNAALPKSGFFRSIRTAWAMVAQTLSAHSIDVLQLQVSKHVGNSIIV